MRPLMTLATLLLAAALVAADDKAKDDAKDDAQPAADAKAKDARKEKTDTFGGWVAGFFDPQPELRSFVERRADAVAKQVEAMRKSK